MGVKMNFSLLTKNPAADPEIGPSHKIDFKALWPRNGPTASVSVKMLTLFQI